MSDQAGYDVDITLSDEVQGWTMSPIPAAALSGVVGEDATFDLDIRYDERDEFDRDVKYAAETTVWTVDTHFFCSIGGCTTLNPNFCTPGITNETCVSCPPCSAGCV